VILSDGPYRVPNSCGDHAAAPKHCDFATRTALFQGWARRSTTARGGCAGKCERLPGRHLYSWTITGWATALCKALFHSMMG